MKQPPEERTRPLSFDGVSIAHRTLQSLNELLRMAADRLTDYMEAANIVDEGTIALIVELDRMREDLY